MLYNIIFLQISKLVLVELRYLKKVFVNFLNLKFDYYINNLKV